MRIGIGLGCLPLLGSLLNLIRVPLDWKIFLILSIIGPVFFLIKKRKPHFKGMFALNKSNLLIIVVLLIFFVHLFVYVSGSFVYPYLEDDDSWDHARSVRYISLKKTAFEQQGIDVYHYIDAYPPGYDIILGVLLQTTDSVYWLLKFFNSLIVSLGLLFFYFFACQFMNSRKKALYATFVLALIPSYLSHFIWAFALAITLFFPLFYSLEMMRSDRKWGITAMVIMASILLTQPTVSVKIGIMLVLYWFTKLLVENKFFIYLFFVGVGSILLALVTWWIPMFVKYGWPEILRHGISTNPAGRNTGNPFKIIGTADRVYEFKDFFFAQKTNMINNPIGVGVVLSVIVLLILVVVILQYKKLGEKKNVWLTITIVWLLFTFVGVIGHALPFQLIAFRFWALFAIPLSLIAAEGITFIITIGKHVKIPELFVFVILLVGLVATSGYQRYSVNTAQWPPGIAWTSQEEVQGYVQLKELPLGSRIFTLTGSGDSWVTGFDHFVCTWCRDELEFKKTAITKTPQEIYDFIKQKDYEYFILDGVTAQNHGANETTQLLQDVLNSTMFSLVYSTEGMVLFRVV